jgi:hypothetical protein
MRIITSGRRSPSTLLLLLALAVPALADMGPEVKMVLHAPEGVYPVAGQTFSFDFEITSATSTTVTAPDLRSGRTPAGQFAWEVVSFPVPTGTRLVAMQPATYPVQLQCNDPAQPIEISLEVEGRTATQRFYLLPQGLNSAMGGSETIMAFDSDQGPALSPDDGFARPDPAPVIRKNVRDLRKEMPANPATGRNIRVRGRFVYYRNSYDTEGNYEGDGRTMGADGVTVNVYDSDWEWDDLLAQTSLGPDGSYDLTFWYDDAEAPDIYVEFLAANNKVDLVYPSIWNISYRWSTPTKEDYNGTDINWGLRHPATESHYAGLNLLASATRTWRWLDANGYGSIDGLLISWPDSDWPHYNSIWETIYIPEFKQWYEGTICHEYGHHWQQDFTEIDGSDYCNTGGRCDDPAGDCRHCPWCEETTGDALREGFPDWISNAVTASWPSSYGFSAIFEYDWESVDECGWNDLDEFDDPWKTEGNIAAFLQDLVDDDNDADPNALPGGADVVTWSAARILSTQASYDPTTPAGLIARLQSRYPESRDAIWMAAANARFNGLDTQAPSALSGLASNSHATSGDSPDGTVELVWNAASDGDSGINGYSVRVGTVAGLIPDVVIETTTTAWTSDDLEPGTYWFTVRAVDRAVNAGAHASFGPVTIRPWEAADLEAMDGGYWPYPVVPRITGNATYTSAPLPAVLVGNDDNTFMNVRIGNSGELATSPTLRLNLLVDGALWWYSSITTLDGYHDRPYMNIGPSVVKGGRHAVMMWADAYEQMPEVDEADNIYVRQFIWYPFTLYTNGTWVDRQRPPDAWGGFNPGLFSAPNCDGFAFGLNSDPFVGAVMVAGDDASDFDLRLHAHTTGPTSGFGYFDIEAFSNRPAGCVEGVFVNNSQTSETVFDVGVVNPDFDGYGFKIRRMFSTLMPTGSDVQFPLSPLEPLALRHFTMSGGSGTNYGTVTLQVDPAVGPVRMKVMHSGLADAGLGDISDLAVTDADGFAKVDFTYGGVTQGLAVWQDPRDVPDGGSGHFGVTVRAFVRRPDFVPLTTAGWHAPLVPTYPMPGTPASTPLPATLVGNATVTYINAQFRNQDAGTAGPFDSMTYLDGTSLLGEQISMLAGFTDRIRNFPTARNVRGGRHTLSMHPDDGDDVAEGDETNNAMGAQYVWSPLNLTAGAVINRTAPPDPTGGFADVLAWSSAPTWYNCDGLRSPVPAPSGDNGRWAAVAALPGAASDVDLRLHEKVDSSLQGFSTAHAVSVWGPAESDYVLVNFRSTTPRQFDVGALGIEGNQSFRVHAAVSSWLDNDPQGDYGPFNFGATNLIALHEVWLPAGPLLIELHDTGGDGVDWGLTLHRGQLPYHAKSASAGIVAQSWIAGAGQDESLPAIVPQAGYYCLAIWKAGAADVAKAGQYELTFNPGTTPVPGDGGPPAVTAVREITPNPFNPSTRIAFDLARDGRVTLEVFDLRGRPVRRLLAADLPAGRHEATWDGHDDDGNGVASGTYFARLSGADGASTRKMLLLK